MRELVQIQIDSIEALLGQHRDNPYPLYRQLRQAGPVLVDAQGKIVVSSYADCRALLHDPAMSVDFRTSASHQEQEHDEPDTADPPPPADEASFIELDPPEHTRLRRLVGDAFAARAAKAAPRVADVVEDFLTRLARRRRCEAVGDFAQQIPTRVLAGLLDIDRADHDKLRG